MAMFNRLAPKPEHLEAVIAALEENGDLTPVEIAKRSGLSHTAVHGAVESLEREGRVRVVRQNKTPKVVVGLPTNQD